ncbi:MAG TPA: methylthioribulose 1-phosphate dehydratase [Planctomycetales bacterium]|jgi:methylthioribulose-1-phosphate dehydratase|nr:methylthioribulose 1-phosphate dehydratase [Planctomycetales bacterium]
MADVIPIDDAVPPTVHAGVEALRDVAALFWQQGWSRGTSSNYSIVLNRDPFRLLLTASGKDKRRLRATDFVVVDEAGRLVAASEERPSAETGLHLVLAKQPGVGSVLHTHSVWGTLLSELYAPAGGFRIEGYEMLKGLTGVRTHEHREWVPIFPNTQDIPSLARDIAKRLIDPVHTMTYGFLIRGHGLYTWGRDVEEARQHVEIFEFLFEVVARRLSLEAAFSVLPLST